MPKNSIKSHLFIFLSTLITLTLLVIALISFNATKNEVKEVFDANLVRVAKLLLNLTKHEVIEHENQEGFTIDLGIPEDIIIFHKYEYKAHFQIWKTNRLIYNSSPDLVIDSPNKIGFSDVDIANHKWRNFTLHDEESDLTIEILEKKDIRFELIGEILLTLIFPLLLSFIPILLIIWIVVNKGLLKLTRLSKEIRDISPSLLTPFEDNEDLPIEVKPLVDSLNSLLIRLGESMSAERRFIDYASHELRTPLSVIKTRTQILIKKHKDDKIYNDLNKLMHAVDRIISLSDQLLTLSRIDSENEIIEKEKVDLGATITQAVKDFDFIYKKKKIKINAKISSNCNITANDHYIKVMFSNLLSNAIKYSPDKEEIKISLTKKNSKITFTIFNKGDLLSKEDQKKILKRFYRAKDNKKEGSGLGLSIVKKILDLYGGKIKFVSDSNGNLVTVVF